MNNKLNQRVIHARILKEDTSSISKKKQASIRLCSVLIGAICVSTMSYAELSFGDKNAEAGQLQIKGAVRAKYNYDFDTEPTQSKLTFGDAVLWLNYESPQWLAHLDYRIYEYYGHIGDANWLTNAWVGYKINPESKIIAGLNPVPFGLGRFWGGSYYLGIANAVGLEDVHNLGIKYDFNNGTDEFQLAYYPTDGGNYSGKSKDARRFSINPVDADDFVQNGTNTQERNSFVARYAHQFKAIGGDENFKSTIGASAWYSEIDNKRWNNSGDRKLWSVFANTTYNQWNLQTLAAYQDIDNADQQYKDHLTFGGFDNSFNVATKGQIYSAELSYTLAENVGPFTGVKPYFNYSTYLKAKDGFKDSTRLISGVAVNYEKLVMQAEFLMGKHDPYLGDSNGLAQGGVDDSWYKKIFVSLGYYF